MHASLARCCCWQRRRHMRRVISDCSSGYNGRSKLLRVVGLTDDGALVCFSELAPRRQCGTSAMSCGLVPPDRSADRHRLSRPGRRAVRCRQWRRRVSSLTTSNATATLVNVLDCGALEGSRSGWTSIPPRTACASVSDTGQNLRLQRRRGRHPPPTSRSTTHRERTQNPASSALRTRTTTSPHRPRPRCSISTRVSTRSRFRRRPTNGSLNPTGMTTVDSGSAAGFDIYSELKKAVTFSNRWLRCAERR